MLGAWLLVAGIASLWTGDGASLPPVAIGTVLVATIAATVVLVVWDSAVLRLLFDHAVIGAVLLGAATAAVVVLTVLVRGPVVVVPTPWAIGCGLVVLAVLTGIVLAERRRGTPLEDPITFPRS